MKKFDGLAERVIAFRKKTGLTQQECAEKAGVSPNVIIQLESGKGVVSTKSLERISQYLDSPEALKEDSLIWYVFGHND